MEFETVKSSYIKGTHYNKEKKELRVKFKNGVIWKYFDVPESAHVSMLLADSIGKFFGKEIKGVFSGRKVEAEPEEESE